MKTLTTILAAAALLTVLSIPATAETNRTRPGQHKPGASAIYDRWGNLRSGKSGLADFPTRIKATKSLPRGKRGSASSPH